LKNKSIRNSTRDDYDKLDRVVKLTDPQGQAVQYGYDPNGNLTSFKDAKLNLTQFSYDARNRLSSKTDPLLQVESYGYDEAGNLKRVTNRKGQDSGFTYDYLNRRRTAGFGAPVGTTAYLSTITYTPDAAGRVTQVDEVVSGITSTITRAYTGLDLLKTEISPQGRIDYGYYANGLRQTMTVAGQHAVNYSYDNASRLTQIAQGTTTVGFTTYDESNRLTKLTLPSGIVATYGYDDVSQLTSIVYTNGAVAVGDLAYDYDLAGRRIAVRGSLARSDVPPAVASTSYDAANRLNAWDTVSLSHDLNGNLTNEGSFVYTGMSATG
jgi:YD repeat-containing protein